MNRIALASAIALASLAGCYKTTYELKPPTMSTPKGEHFHLGVIGIIELSSPINPAAECGGPDASVAVNEQVSILGGLVNMVLGTFVPILHVHNATVGCGGGGAPPAPTAQR